MLSALGCLVLALLAVAIYPAARRGWDQSPELRQALQAVGRFVRGALRVSAALVLAALTLVAVYSVVSWLVGASARSRTEHGKSAGSELQAKEREERQLRDLDALDTFDSMSQEQQAIVRALIDKGVDRVEAVNRVRTGDFAPLPDARASRTMTQAEFDALWDAYQANPPNVPASPPATTPDRSTKP